MDEKDAEIARLKAKLAEAERLDIRFGQKENVCVYGLGQRFPITLYAQGWMKLIKDIDQVLAFIEKHHKDLSWGNNGEKDPFEKSA